jgi:hypothetical protein
LPSAAAASHRRRLCSWRRRSMYLDLASVTMNTTISAPSTTPTASRGRSQRARLAVLVTVLVRSRCYAAVNWAARSPQVRRPGRSQRQAPQAMVSKLRCLQASRLDLRARCRAPARSP